MLHQLIIIGLVPPLLFNFCLAVSVTVNLCLPLTNHIRLLHRLGLSSTGCCFLPPDRIPVLEIHVGFLAVILV